MCSPPVGGKITGYTQLGPVVQNTLKHVLGLKLVLSQTHVLNVIYVLRGGLFKIKFVACFS